MGVTPAAYDRGVTSVATTQDVDATTATRDDPVPPRADVPQVVRRRLDPPMPDDRGFSWIGTGVVVAIAAALRLIGLSHPPGKIFDEIYYATEGNDLIQHGVEWNHTLNTGDFVVHPPLGKWLIGVGEWVFQRPRPWGAVPELLIILGILIACGALAVYTRRFRLLTVWAVGAVGFTVALAWAMGRFEQETFGWRIMPAVFGTLAVLILIRVTRRLFRSTILGLAAGLLLSLDGMEFVLSRTALLDIFLMFFVLAAFACLVMDRDQRRRRWLRALEGGLDPAAPGRVGRPRTGWRESVPWWRLATAVMIGCAASVKWSAIWYVIVFLLLIVAWEVGARRSAGVPKPWRDTLLDETGWLVLCGVIILVVYVASWTGWLVTDHGYDRHFYPGSGFFNALHNLIHYHQDALNFHNGLDTPHPYQSWPWQWLLLGRPVAFYYSGNGSCGAPTCSAEVLLLGTPLLWWSFLPAMVGTVVLSIARRDWRGPAIVLGALAGIVPWFPWEFSHRTMFYFYAVPAVPFLVMTVVYVFGAFIGGPPRMTWFGFDRRAVAGVVFGLYLLIIAWCFMYFYPIYVGETIQYQGWLARMWLGGRWI